MPNFDSIKSIYSDPEADHEPDSAWRTYYETKIYRRFKDEGGIEYYQRRRVQENKPYLDTIRNYLETPDAKLGVVGSGAGMEIIEFLREGVNVTGIDLENVFPLIRENALRHKVEKKLQLMYGDINKLPFSDSSFDVLASHGTLEHFQTDEEIVHAIREGSRVGRTFIFVVPLEAAGDQESRKTLGLTPISDQNTTGNFGNERYMPGTKWEQLIQIAVGTQTLPDGTTFKLEKPFGYWPVKPEGKIRHPRTLQEAQDLYEAGETVYGVYVIKQAPPEK